MEILLQIEARYGQIKGHDAPKYLTAKGAAIGHIFPFLDSKHITEEM